MTSGGAPRRGMVTVLLVATTVAMTGCTAVSPLLRQQPSPSETTTATPTITATPTETRPPAKTGIVKGSHGWSTYTNAKLGISFKFPTTMNVVDGAPCKKEKLASDYTYSMVEGVVPTVLIRDGDTFYITQKYGYQPSDMVGKPPTQVYHGCTKVKTTRQLLHEYRSILNPKTGPFHVLAITVAQVKSKAAVTRYLKRTFSGCPSFKVTGMVINTSGPFRNVNFTCPTDSSYFLGLGTPIYFSRYSKTRYYTGQGLLVMLWFTQVDQIFAPNEKIDATGLSKTEARVGASFSLVG